MLKITNLRVGIDNKRSIEELAAKRIGVSVEDIYNCQIIKKSIDARKKQNICIVYTLAIDVKNQPKVYKSFLKDKDISILEEPKVEEIYCGNELMKSRPLVVGAGPAGLFATYLLAQKGYNPILIERGSCVEKRSLDVERFWQLGQLDVESNVQFGAGGAGTFSDGKLTTRINDSTIRGILNILVECGAPSEILYKHKPHIGTDILKNVVNNLLDRIVILGGRVEFDTRLDDVIIEHGVLKCAIIKDEKIDVDNMVLAIGHSARDTYKMLLNNNVAMKSKPLAVGVRIEHEQSFINSMQYGRQAEYMSEAADYMLTYQDSCSGRGVYSFCMCPGGTVVASTNQNGCVVTNGMSMHSRDGNLANSALVVTVNELDYGEGVLDALLFQERIEQAAFVAGGSDYCAPAQSVKSFLSDAEPSLPEGFASSYLPGVRPVKLSDFLPLYLVESLKRALHDFEARMPGFTNSAVLVAPETRTSAPLRIMRDDESRQSINVKGLYPTGEGAGYAGGIISAAVDGYKTAVTIIKQYAPTDK